MSSVQNPCWLMTIWGYKLSNILGIATIHDGNHQAHLYQPERLTAP